MTGISDLFSGLTVKIIVVMKTNIFKVKAFSFALDSIHLYRILLEKREFVISRQLLRSATSIGANVEEATAAQSRKDFISKMAIASKEARETRYWLKLLDESHFVDMELNQMIDKVEEINKILTSIVKSSQENL
jgi:four helix bundle protein